MVAEAYFIAVASTLTTAAAGYVAKKAKEVADAVEENRERSKTNREVLKGLVEDIDRVKSNVGDRDGT